MSADNQSKRKNGEDLKRIRNRALIRLVKLLNVVLMTIPFIVVWALVYKSRVDVPFYRKGNYLMYFLFMLLYYLLAHLYSGFLINLNRVPELVYSQALSAFFDNFIMYVVTWLLIKHLPPVWPLLLSFAAEVLIAVLWAKLARDWYTRAFPLQKTVIVWEQEEHLEELLQEGSFFDRYDVVAMPTVAESLASGMEMLSGADAVFLSDVHSHERNRLLKYCMDKGIQTYVLPGVGDAIMSSAVPMNLFNLPILKIDRYNPTPEYLIIKRATDIVLSAAALIVLSPVMLAVAAAIKISDGGDVFYRQTRLTKNGRRFRIIKFRSMKMNAEKDGVARLSTGEADDRITPVGRVIRKVRLDEVPQFINVLIGDMSLVGPRPERPEIAAQYEKEIPEFSLRLQAKAGLTGYAQVHGKYNTTPYVKLLMDLYYLAKPSIAMDLQLMMATVKILFVRESTEGIGSGQTTARPAPRRKKAGDRVPKETEEER